jgi:hypothetical protein
LILAAASSLMKRKLLSFGKKFQIVNNKQITMTEIRNSKRLVFDLFEIWILSFGIYLYFGACILVLGIILGGRASPEI